MLHAARACANYKHCLSGRDGDSGSQQLVLSHVHVLQILFSFSPSLSAMPNFAVLCLPSFAVCETETKSGEHGGKTRDSKTGKN